MNFLKRNEQKMFHFQKDNIYIIIEYLYNYYYIEIISAYTLKIAVAS